MQTGFALYVMRRQKHTRTTKAQKKESPDEQQAAEATGDGATQTQTAADHVAVEDYEKMLKKIASFSTVEGFWRVYGHMNRPAEIPYLTDVHVFRDNIKPVWEDPANKGGGKLVIKVKKGLGSRYWEMLLLAMVGEQFGDLGGDVCGAVISVRHNEDVISVWTRNGENTERLKDMLRKCIKLPGFVSIDYKKHDVAAVTGPTERYQEPRATGAPPPPPPQAAWRTQPAPPQPAQRANAPLGGDWRS